MSEKQYPIKYDPSYFVVTANDIIKGRQKMTLRESQILSIAIAQVVKEDKDFKTYTTNVPELAAFMGITEDSLYRDLEGICTCLCQQIVKIQIGGENARGRKKWEIFHWISSAKYDNGKLTLRLSDDIKPYLLDLESYYSQTLLGVLMTFRSYYATRLYQYLRVDADRAGKDEWYFTIDELRELFQPYVKDDKGNIIKELYSRTYNLIQKTIKPALAELGASDYAYVWDYAEERAKKRGNPLIGVRFKILFFNSKEEKDYYITRAKPLIEAYEREKTAGSAAGNEPLLDGQTVLEDFATGEKGENNED